MSLTPIEKAKKVLRGIEEGDYLFDMHAQWRVEYHDEYFKYFNHPDPELRKRSLLIFMSGLGETWQGSTLLFTPLKEKENDENPIWTKIYLFEDYLKSFLENRESIKKDYPLLYEELIRFLIKLDIKKRFEDSYVEIDKEIFVELRKVLDEYKDLNEFGESYFGDYNEIYKECGFPPFSFK
ncbi:hypothetical protein [Psychrobacillus sp. BL-248-WT-3]|uniref:hypothetical protein n=1 Tax=Psychrobacillus sp. BL-248-WT-3 TaxID=2725306 RepID=UPI00146A100A|nr:hypothetical protein [Psychrobacillus sp. BL-248-WT-3]NME04389.1 hypothetical protein [Psychrobacillus sp. BL-248-WT-3]